MGDDACQARVGDVCLIAGTVSYLSVEQLVLERTRVMSPALS